MKSKEFFGKFVDKYLWGNLLAMAIVVAVLCVGVKLGLDRYTHHGEGIPVPDVRGMSFEKARALLEADGLRVEVHDTGFNKRLPADCVLLQNPGNGSSVKAGHLIYVTINSVASPTLVLPDLVDNSSLREAEAKLEAMGFRLMEPKAVTGEKDWVYGIMARGRRLSTGDRVAIDIPLTLLVGSGMYSDSSMEVDITEQPDNGSGSADADEFTEVGAPPAGDSRGAVTGAQRETDMEITE